MMHISADSRAPLICVLWNPLPPCSLQPTQLNKSLCQCGHAALYHSEHVAARPGASSRAGPAELPPPVVDDAVLSRPKLSSDDDDLYRAGWTTFQDKKGLERSEEVPQYDADFSAENDLKDPTVLRQMRQDMELTGRALRETHLTLRDQFRALLRKRGGI